MRKLELINGLYLYPTAAGAYYAVSAPEQDKPRQFIQQLLLEEQTPALNMATLQRLMQNEDEAKVLQQLLHCQKLGWVQGVDAIMHAPGGALDEILPGLLAKISENGKVLLADDQGFYLVCSGFTHEVAEELSAISAELARVHERRSGVLINNLGVGSHAWAIVDAFGSSQIGCWPLFIGKQRFVLAISGVPHFNQPEFVTLVWALMVRYLKNSNKIEEKI